MSPCLYNRIFIRVCMVLLFSSVSRAQQNAVEFYIAPHGCDSSIGTQEKPFRSLKRAKEVVGIQLKETPNKSVVVNIRGGVYYLETPVVFNSEDSGSEESPVVYKAVDGERPIFTGSLDLEDWQLLSNQERLGLLPLDVRGSIYVTDLNAAGIRDFGDPTDKGKRPDLYCNGQLQTLSRWPNQGFIKAGQVKGKTALPPTYVSKHGTVEGIFEYTSKTQDRWAKKIPHAAPGVGATILSSRTKEGRLSTCLPYHVDALEAEVQDPNSKVLDLWTNVYSQPYFC